MAATTTTTAATAQQQQQPAILLDVGGMKCGGCSAAVKRMLLAQPGIETAAVNLLTETAAITLTPEAAALVAAVEGGGATAAAASAAFAQLLQLLYIEDVLSEEAVLAWADEKEGADEKDRAYLAKAQAFVDWLREEEEDEDEDEDEDDD